MDAKGSARLLILLALGALYFIWGSTYLAMRFAIDSFPPFMMAAIRFSFAGALLYGFLRVRGDAAPTRQEWLGASTVGILLLTVGNASVAVAEQSVSSGASALAIATVPLWMAVFSAFWGQRPSGRECIGILTGTIGVGVLNLGANMQASPLGAAILLLAAVSWAFGSVWGKHLPMPRGAMASAAQMLAAGMCLIIISMATGESWPHEITDKSVYAIIYLITFGSLIAYSAYLFLLKTVRPAFATSYAFVNPVVAMLLGTWLAGESIDRAEYAALAIIVAGVLLVLPFKHSH
jgi:drug/metabolite transporter (DMT)-like permease